MIIIKDLRILNKYKKLGLEFDKEFKYLTSDYNILIERELRKDNIIINYVSGCFYPYLFKIEAL